MHTAPSSFIPYICKMLQLPARENTMTVMVTPVLLMSQEPFMVGPCGPGAHGLPLTTCWGKKKYLVVNQKPFGILCWRIKTRGGDREAGQLTLKLSENIIIITMKLGTSCNIVPSGRSQSKWEGKLSVTQTLETESNLPKLQMEQQSLWPLFTLILWECCTLLCNKLYLYLHYSLWVFSGFFQQRTKKEGLW